MITRSKRIFLVRFSLTGKGMSTKSKPMLLVALKWEKAPCYQVKTSLTSDKLIYLIYLFFLYFLLFYCLTGYSTFVKKKTDFEVKD